MTEGPQVDNLDALIARLRPAAEAARATRRRRLRRAIVAAGVIAALAGLGVGLVIAYGFQHQHGMRHFTNRPGPR